MLSLVTPFSALRVSTSSLKLLHHRRVVEHLVVGDDHAAVDAVVHRLLVDALEIEMRVLELRHVRIGVADDRAALRQQLEDVERRRLAQVVDVALVGDADHVHARAVDRLLLRVQRIDDPLHHELRHRAVDDAGQLDEARLEVVLLAPSTTGRTDRSGCSARRGPGPDRTA